MRRNSCCIKGSKCSIGPGVACSTSCSVSTNESPSNGFVPVIVSYTMQPKEKMSDR